MDFYHETSRFGRLGFEIWHSTFVKDLKLCSSDKRIGCFFLSSSPQSVSCVVGERVALRPVYRRVGKHCELSVVSQSVNCQRRARWPCRVLSSQSSHATRTIHWPSGHNEQELRALLPVNPDTIVMCSFGDCLEY